MGAGRSLGDNARVGVRGAVSNVHGKEGVVELEVLAFMHYGSPISYYASCSFCGDFSRCAFLVASRASVVARDGTSKMLCGVIALVIYFAQSGSQPLR